MTLEDEMKNVDEISKPIIALYKTPFNLLKY